MPSPIVWESIPKSQSDPQTITEAVAAGIAVHDADPDAHMAELASLEAHRDSEIIDHLAESVVNDKLAATTRAFTAIVDDNSPADYDNLQDAVDYVNSVGGGVIKMRPGIYTLTDDLILSPLVSLLGEGTQVTQIVSDSSTRRYINYAQFFNTASWAYEIMPFATNDDTFYSNVGNFDFEPVLGMRCGIIFDPGPTFYGNIIDFGSDYVILDETAPADSDGAPELDFYIGGEVTNGSKTMVLAGDQTTTNTDLYVGMQLRCQENGFVAYVQEIIDSVTVLMSVPFSDDDGTYTFDRSFTGEHLPFCEGITFGAADAPVEITTGGFGFRLECIRCEFLTGHDAIFWNPQGFLGYLNEPFPLLRLYDCLIFCDSTDPAIYSTYARFEACQFLPRENGSKGLNVLYLLWVTDCLFGDSSFAGTYTNNKWVETAGDANYISNSRFYDTKNLGVYRYSGDNDLEYIVMEGCFISTTANQTISLIGTRNRITGCDILHAGTTTFALGSSFTDSIFSNCIHNKTLTNSSTNCAVANNITYT